MDFSKRFIIACVSSCVMLSPVLVNSSHAQPIELVGPNSKKAQGKAAIYGPVSGTDTLWRIAFNHRPDPKLSVDQVMIAIFMANPHAFKNNDIHSITDGTTLSIPSAADIASISDATAKLRIANNAQLKSNQPTPTPVAVPTPVEQDSSRTDLPSKTNNVVTSPLPVDSLPKKAIDEMEPEMVEAVDDTQKSVNMIDNTSGLNSQLALAMSDMQLLIKENEALRAQIAGLDGKLAEMQTQEALDLQAHDELAQLKEELAEIELAKDTEHQSIFNNGWVVATLASIPSVGLLGGLFFWLSRRNKSLIEPEQAVEKLANEPELVPDLETEDELLTEDLDDDLLIAEDDDDLLEISDIDDLSELDELPDLDDELLTSDDELLVPSDLDEIQLDDSSVLPAEEPEDDNILAQDDLEALLAQADDLEAEEAEGDPDLSDEIVSADDIDALLAQADSLDGESDDGSIGDDDIDALLDEANSAVDADDVDALLDAANVAEPEAAVDADDIDALLDAANVAEPEAAVDADDIDALLDAANVAEPEAAVDADDIDALLDAANVAESEATVDADDVDALLDAANVAEPEAAVDADDIDALLDAANVAEPEAAVDADDIDALLDAANVAEPKAAVDADDIDALLDAANVAEPEAAAEADDIDALLDHTDALMEDTTDTLPVDDVDSLLQETDALAEDDVPQIDNDELDALLAETEAIVDETAGEESLNVPDDLDELLAETDALIDSDDTEIPVEIDSNDIDDLLNDTDALLEPQLQTVSTLEELSQLDTVDEPYLMTQDLVDEFDEGSVSKPDTEAPLTIEPQPSLTPDVVADDSELAPSQEAQHLVDALDNMLDETENSIPSSKTTGELDAFINPQAIEIDDAQLSQSMAEFDEDSIIEQNTEKMAQETNKPEALADDLLIDAEAALNEQLPKFEQEHSFIDIDKLLDESAMNEQESEPYQNVDLDIGLDEFPEVLPETGGIDVDDDPNGASKKLDLARAYLEIDDEDSAIDMLEQVKQSGDQAQIKEVEKLMKRLKS